MLWFQIIFLFILFLVVFYYLIHFRKLPFIKRFVKPFWLSWLLAFILNGIFIFLALSVFSYFMVILLFLLYAFMITDVLHVIIRKFVKKDNVRLLWAKVYYNGIAAVFITLVLSGISYYSATHVVTTSYDIKTQKSLGVSELKISMISDLHLGTTMNAERFTKYCEKIQNYQPDIIVLDGDIFDENTSREEMERAGRMLGQIQSKYGTYYVFGNHDKPRRSINPNFTEQDIMTVFETNHIQVLNDECRLVNNQFYIMGRKDASFFQNADRKSLHDLLNGIDKSKFILELDHQPLDLEEASQEGIDLQLSGHTHGGQIWPVGAISELFHIDEFVYGYKKMGSFQVIVSSGIGAWGYPAKLGSKAEMVQISIQ